MWSSLCLLAYLFSPAQGTSGDLTLSIAEVAPITALEREIPIQVTLENSESGDLRGSLRLDVIDRWRIVGEAVKAFRVPPGGRQALQFICIAGEGTYAAHYPIHATAILEAPEGEARVHTVLVIEVTQEAVTRSKHGEGVQTILTLQAPGRLVLDAKEAQVSFALGDSGDVQMQPVGWSGTDATTGTSVHRATVYRGESRRAIGVHPPWRTGWGQAGLDWSIRLPDARPIFLDFATAIRDHDPQREPPSDGVQFQVWVAPMGTERFTQVFDRFSDAKRWEAAQVELSDFAGQTVRLRLLTHPGPAHDTTCDQAYWAEPTLVAGVLPRPVETDQQRETRIRQAGVLARRALNGETQNLMWRLASAASAAIVPGPYGAIDGILSIATPKGQLTYEGFGVEVDGRRVDDWRSGFAHGEPRMIDNTFFLPVTDGEDAFEIATQVWSESGGLRLRFWLEGVEPDLKGHPRLTHISLGRVSEKLRRLYAGHGNVLEAPGTLELRYDGFHLSTSFVGFDFANGVSLVQATDIPPDGLRVDAEGNIATLEAHHNVTLTLVPAMEGAFAAAHRYRELIRSTGVEAWRTPTVEVLRGKMCLDQWDGDYARAAEDIERAARYGLTDAVFVKHVWQRWGYDYRLPDIYPPAGSMEDFQRLADACKRTGILFAPHDNYIDFYPDAPGFSYRHIIFNDDGTPQRAWYNEWRDAQSYRWLPHAFQPWMEENLKRIWEGIGPSSYFIDVFSAIAPMDYYDETGRFYPKTETIARWGAAFDQTREAFGGVPTISEAGHDALIGHLDAAQADHAGWTPENRPWTWNVPAADGERVPWHDRVTHGRFILFAGGLGSRYAGDGALETHGYGSDDYLSMTVLGGRNPMCDGPFNRRAVMTYWLLHDICAALAQQEMTQHTFVDDDIHRQVVHFGEEGQVVVNRGKTDWEVDGQALPPYGFIARSGAQRATIARRSGRICAWAEGPNAIFVDARPPEHFGALPIQVEILGVESLGGRRFALSSRWHVTSPVAQQGDTFIHFVNPQVAPDGEQIAFQARFPIGPEQWRQPGVYDVRAEGELPANLPLGAYDIRFGIWQPQQGGGRLMLPGGRDATGRRMGGTLVFAGVEGTRLTVRYEPPPEASEERLNLDRRMVEFDAITTDGAFRLLKDKWLLIPLPGSEPFQVTLDLVVLGLPTEVRRVESLNETLESQREVAFTLENGRLHFTTDDEAFAYRFGQ